MPTASGIPTPPNSPGEGKPVNLIREQLGHRSLATTDRYLRDIAPEERLAALRAREWNS